MLADRPRSLDTPLFHSIAIPPHAIEASDATSYAVFETISFVSHLPLKKKSACSLTISDEVISESGKI
jgi:hypothetical protein